MLTKKNSRRPWLALLPIVLLLLIPLIIRCGGGGGGQPIEGDEFYSILIWEQPLTFADNTALDPLIDIDRYDIYLNDTGFFNEEDVPVASIAAVEDVLIGETYITQPLWYFDLAHLETFGIGPGHWVSVRSVGLDNNISEFSEPIFWGNPNQEGGM